MPRVVVVGSLNMDLVIRAPRFPAAGETIVGGPFGAYAGGKGANQAVAAARLGAQVAFVGCVGRDAHGDELRARLASEGTDLTHLANRGGASTGVAVITLDASGQNTIVVALGANLALSARDIEAAREQIAEADAVILQLEVPQEANRRAMEIAREAQVPVIFNAAPAQPVAPDLLAMVDLLIVNEFEGRVLSRLDDPSVTEAQIASHLSAMSQGHVIMTLGERGALHFDGERLMHRAAFPVESIDATGAGDAFVAAFAIAWCEGREIRESLSFACAAGALAVTKMGALTSLPGREAVEAFVAASVKSGSD